MSVVEPEPAVEHLLPVQVSAPSTRGRILGRVYILTAILLTEYLAIVSVPHPWCFLHRAVAAAIVFVAVFLVIARASLQNDVTEVPLNRKLLPLYFASLGVIALTHAALLLTSLPRTPLEVIWFTAIPVSALVLLCVMIPVPWLPNVLRRTRSAWLYAAIAGLLVALFTSPVEAIWNDPDAMGGFFIRNATFRLVARLLRMFYPQVMADPVAYQIGLPNFDVFIAATCSGIEGLCLTLMFGVGWLWYARRELRFPQALLLVPASLALIWTLNIVRIATLIAIGNAGHPQVAGIGFHSEAGWIAFNVVTIGFLLAAHRVPWFSKTASHKQKEGHVATRNVAAIYLLPFLAILTAAFFAKAVSSGFEWAYFLRFLAAATVLWHYRDEYRRIDWTFSWPGPAIGALVFGMWLGLSHWASPSASSLGATLAAMDPTKRLAWLIFRVAAAVITVPLAEELAFRGFLMRRVVSADVESVAYRSATWIAILISSVVFGLMHGRLWIAGIIAGVAYAFAAKRTNRLGEAVAAHATTNLMLAIWVLTRGDWGLW